MNRLFASAEHEPHTISAINLLPSPQRLRTSLVDLQYFRHRIQQFLTENQQTQAADEFLFQQEGEQAQAADQRAAVRQSASANTPMSGNAYNEHRAGIVEGKRRANPARSLTPHVDIFSAGHPPTSLPKRQKPTTMVTLRGLQTGYEIEHIFQALSTNSPITAPSAPPRDTWSSKSRK